MTKVFSMLRWILTLLLPITALLAQESLLMIGPQGAYVRLRDDTLGPDETLTGGMGGGRVFYQYKKWKALYTSVYTSWLYGKASKDHLICRTMIDGDVEGRFGYNYQGLQSGKLMVTPYIGYGFHYSDEKLESYQGTERFFYFVYYIPVGLVLDWEVKDWFHWQFHFQWRPDIDPTVKQRGMSRVRFVMHKKENQFLVEMPFSFRVGEERNWDLSFVPFWRITKHGRSLITGNIRYTYWGAAFLAGYHF